MYQKSINILAGGLLIGAVALKALSPSDIGFLILNYQIPYWMIILFIQIELLVGVLLVSNTKPVLMRCLAITLFSLFALFSIYRAVSGFESCGCFGAIKVNPWITLGLDLLVISLLISTGRPATENSTQDKKILIPMISYALIGGTTLAIMMINSPQKLDTAIDFNSFNGTVILEPETWINKLFPLVNEIEPSVDLTNGDWVVLLYHHDCQKCQESLPRYEGLGDSSIPPKHVLLVEVPPTGNSTFQNTEYVKHVSLKKEVDWFVQAPVEIQLSNGIVKLVSLELPSIN